MKKIIIAIITGLLIISLMFLSRNILKTITIEKKLQLSVEEKNELNYSELIEDIKSLESKKGIKHAKFVKKEEIQNSLIRTWVSEYKYYGEGYYIIMYPGDDGDIYKFYTNEGKKIYERGISSWSGILHNIEDYKENIFYIFFVAIVIITDLCICIIIYIRSKKKIRNENERSI